MVVPVEAIERIDIVRGTMSVLYGRSTFFGVVNMIIDQKDNPENHLGCVIKRSRHGNGLAKLTGFHAMTML